MDVPKESHDLARNAPHSSSPPFLPPSPSPFLRLHPEMNEKIELASLMAPVAYLGHARSPLHYLAPFADQIDVNKSFAYSNEP